jgi:opacity protein-like surface antigen
MQVYRKRILILVVILLSFGTINANTPNRVGTTTANFLEIGFGSAGIAMGDAYVSVANDLSSAYWNPAGLAFMQHNEALFMIQPWVLDVNSSFAAVGVPLPGIGTFALDIVYMGFGEMEVTTLSQQDGTGEIFDANEFAVTLSYGRSITEWFAFGAGIKYVSSQIWQVTGSAVAFDLGVLIKTEYFSLSGSRNDGLSIGMSISNYGTKLQYDGTNLLNPIDIEPDENGNYRDVPGQFRLSSWELPLIFRVGVSMKPIVSENHQVIIAIDALHPNNNKESINVGTEYSLKVPTFGKLFLRAGYKALFIESSEFGLTLGAGFTMNLMKNTNLTVDYAYRDLGILGSTNCFGLGIQF